MQTSADKVRTWQLRAEEYRTAADNVSNPTVRETYLRLARNYDQLAEMEQANERQRERVGKQQG